MTKRNADIVRDFNLTPLDFLVNLREEYWDQGAPWFVECAAVDESNDHAWGHFPTKKEAYRFIAQLTGIEIYVEQWSTFDAEEAGLDADGRLASPAPFGDNTYRVVDEREGGVVAYFGSEDAAQDYADFLIESAI